MMPIILYGNEGWTISSKMKMNVAHNIDKYMRKEKVLRRGSAKKEKKTRVNSKKKAVAYLEAGYIRINVVLENVIFNRYIDDDRNKKKKR